MKKVFALLICGALAIGSLTGCSGGETVTSSKSTQTKSDTKTTDKKENKTSKSEDLSNNYEKYNVLSFSNIEYSDFMGLGTVDYSFTVTNIGQYPTDDIEYKISAKDFNSKSLGTMEDELKIRLNPGESAECTGFILDDVDINKIDSCEVIQYNYIYDNEKYTVSNILSTARKEKKEYDDQVDFNQANIISLNNLERVETSDECEYRIKYTAVNNGNIEISNFAPNFAFYTEDGTYCDMTYGDISVGNYTKYVNYDQDSAKQPGEGWDMEVHKTRYKGGRLGRADMVKYKYTLTTPDSNGYTEYEVNLQTGIAIGHK